MDEREKYAKLYCRLISPQSEQSIVNYFSYKLEKLLEEEYVSNQSIDFWKGFKKFIQIQEKRLNLEKDRNILYNTLEESLFDSQEPHKVLDILSWLDVKLTTITQPQQETKAEAPQKKGNLYNEYFKGNTFLLFKKYCEDYNIDNTCRTDLRVLFQLFDMKGFFADTIELKHYLKFLSHYLKYDNTELKKVDLNTKPNIKRQNDFNRIKSDLKLTLE